MKVSFIATVFNEQRTITEFLKSLISQTRLPDEIVIVDGGSSDKTFEKMQKFLKSKKVSYKLLIKKGNRSIGRNYAIKNAAYEIIACSDAGNILDKDWIKNIIKPFNNREIDVVAGYYSSKAKTLFEKCITPYVLVMDDRVDEKEFLPATRSIAFKKSIWKKIKGFPEQYSHNEDYIFANRLKQSSAHMVFEKHALVNWVPRKNIKEAFTMFYRFAFGDAESSMWRFKVLMIFARYFLLAYLMFLTILYKSSLGFSLSIIAILIYLLWSAVKNKRYVKEKKAYGIFVILQLISDVAVISGTTLGIFKKLIQTNLPSLIRKNLPFIAISFLYVFLVVATLNYGIPNQNRPFPFHMDEWHQLHAVWTTFSKGTPNTPGSANGTILHFLISGFYMAPFVLAGIVNTAQLEINNLVERMQLFQILRLNSILFGVLSIFIFYKIIQLLRLKLWFSLALFTFTPIWLMLSGYFKYDITLTFFILLSILTLLYFHKKPTNRNFILASVPVGLAFSVKVSALPLIAIYFISYFIFANKTNFQWRSLALGAIGLVGSISLFGVPDTIFGKGNILDYLHDNLVVTPSATSNYNFGMHYLQFLYLKMYPELFGHGLYFLGVLSFFYWILRLVKKPIIFFKEKKIETFFLLCSSIFILSILTLRINAVGNRVLVMLPFLVLMGLITIQDIEKRIGLRKVILPLTLSIIAIQVYVSIIFVHMKTTKPPQEISSEWIIKNIPKRATIGIENIPIYQVLPDIVHKEFYFNEYGIGSSNLYSYEIVNAQSKSLPEYVVITNGEFEQNLLKKSVKKDLIERLKKEGYMRIATFKPDFSYYHKFGDPIVFNIFSLFASPLNTSIFKK